MSLIENTNHEKYCIFSRLFQKDFYKYVWNCVISLQSRTLLSGNNKSDHSVKFYKAELSRLSALLKFTEISNIPPRTEWEKSGQFSVSKVHSTCEYNRIVVFAIFTLTFITKRYVRHARYILIDCKRTKKRLQNKKSAERLRCCDKLKLAVCHLHNMEHFWTKSSQLSRDTRRNSRN